MFAKRFKYLRESNDISQKDMAKIFSVGPSTVSMWEQDKRTPDKEMLVKIADYFNVTTDYLLGRTTIPNNTEREMLKNSLRGLKKQKINDLDAYINTLGIGAENFDRETILVEYLDGTKKTYSTDDVIKIFNSLNDVGIDPDFILKKANK